MSAPVQAPLTVSTVDGTVTGRPISVIKVSNGDLTISGNQAVIDTSGSGGSPGGSTTEIQYNNAGAFGGSPDFFLTDIGAALPKINILSSTTANQAILSPSTFRLDGGTGLGVLTTTTADNGLILTTGTEGITGPILHLDSVTSPSNALLQNQTTDGTITIQTTAGTGDITVSAIGDLHLGGGLTLALTAATTASVTSTATNNNMNFNIIANGSGTPKAILKNASMEVDLTCEADGKLYIRDPTSGNRFILDSSGAATGITFPDSTVQTTAASGGGASYNQARNPNADLYPGYTTYILSRGVGFTTVGAMVSTVSTRASYRQIQFRPFIAPETGDLTEFSAYVDTAGAATDIQLGIYDDDGGAPNDLLGTATIDCSSTGSKTQTSISATISLVEGVQYWYSWVTTNSTDSPTLRAEDQDYTQFASPQTNSIASSDSQVYILDVLASANTSPATITRTNLYPVGGNSGGNPRIGVQY